jgi:aminoglycoside phosphotransferase (APT) family kinase protein
MGREYTILSAIGGRYRYAPKVLDYCEDESVIGAKFYVMERIPGVVLRREKPADWNAAPETVRAICTNFVKALADLHAVDWKAAGLESLRREGHFMERQVLGWEKRYYGSQTDDIEGVQGVFDWCKSELPEDVGAVLIHNDFKFDNVLLDSEDLTRVAGVLDWEMSTIGDPLFDLGVAIGYWVNREGDQGIDVTRGFLTREPGAITRQEFVDLYGELTGRNVADMHYYYVFALIKLAVVIQQIYYRYATGKTTDDRFAPMIMGVKVLTDRARAVIESGKC